MPLKQSITALEALKNYASRIRNIEYAKPSKCIQTPRQPDAREIHVIKLVSEGLILPYLLDCCPRLVAYVLRRGECAQCLDHSWRSRCRTSGQHAVVPSLGRSSLLGNIVASVKTRADNLFCKGRALSVAATHTPINKKQDHPRPGQSRLRLGLRIDCNVGAWPRDITRECKSITLLKMTLS